ncbi:MAG: 1,4-dihydroxy-2-naphthoate octaprenyltransferase [Saprospirales bacterium]|nr:MAG: 1,4-dihydroxy-2-naphthoate octaprenyltransferase [Saprospirales bacterium]
MNKFGAFVKAARLRTLPLSVSGIVAGGALAFKQGIFHPWIFVLSLLVTLSLQVLSNFANDYGDGVKGTDKKRTGEQRLVASGIISPGGMKKAVIASAAVSFLLGLALIFAAFGWEDAAYLLIFAVLGVGAIAAAIKYTVGKGAFGYSGHGDLFVFLFFGLVSVMGSFFLYAKELQLVALLPACIIGFLSTAVLNLNNMRDLRTDKKSKKFTVAVKLGARKARFYHFALIASAFVLALIYAFTYSENPSEWLFLIAFVPLFIHLKKVAGTEDLEKLDPELKKVALSTFLFALLLGLGYLL